MLPGTTKGKAVGAPGTTELRSDFPALHRVMAEGHPLTYLDSANTSQKPQAVIDAVARHYQQHNANVARAVHQLGDEATQAFEGARDKVAAFIGAPTREEVVFTANASASLNMVANVLGWAGSPWGVRSGDQVLITEMEHHSNIVPWQLLCDRTGARLRWFGLTDEGHLDLSDIDELISEQTKVVSLAWVSNMLGTINPIEQIAERAHQVGALVVVDASQAVPHLPVNVADLGVDFLAFTGHKMCGPTGIGVLWGRKELLEQLPPFLGGGEMIETVTMQRSTFAPPPHRFEAGTPPIAQAVGLGAAVDYLTEVGVDSIAAHEHALVSYTLERLLDIDGLTVLGPRTSELRGSAVSFDVTGVHPHDVSQVLDSLGIAVRAGHHCAKPAHDRYRVHASTRASFYLYNTHQEIDALVDGIHYAKRFFTS